MLENALLQQPFPLALSALSVQRSLPLAPPDQILPHKPCKPASRSHRSCDQSHGAHSLCERKRSAQPQPGEESGEHPNGG